MKNQKLKSRGFTLVELLIVITIIGVLAVVVLVGLNPIEQINKGRDTRIIGRAKVVVDACERWYLADGACPGGATGYDRCVAMVGANGELRDSVPCSSVSDLTCSAQGTCSVVTVSVSSNYYRTATRCGADGNTNCTVPEEIIGL